MQAQEKSSTKLMVCMSTYRILCAQDWRGGEIWLKVVLVKHQGAKIEAPILYKSEEGEEKPPNKIWKWAAAFQPEIRDPNKMMEKAIMIWQKVFQLPHAPLAKVREVEVDLSDINDPELHQQFQRMEKRDPILAPHHFYNFNVPLSDENIQAMIRALTDHYHFKVPPEPATLRNMQNFCRIFGKDKSPYDDPSWNMFLIRSGQVWDKFEKESDIGIGSLQIE